MSTIRNIGKRKVIAWKGAILPGDTYISSEEECMRLRLMFPGEFQVIEDAPVVVEYKVVEEPKVIEVVKPHTHARRKK